MTSFIENHEAHEDREAFFSVIPAHAGIYLCGFAMDPGLRWDDASLHLPSPRTRGSFYNHEYVILSEVPKVRSRKISSSRRRSFSFCLRQGYGGQAAQDVAITTVFPANAGIFLCHCWILTFVRVPIMFNLDVLCDLGGSSHLEENRSFSASASG